MTMQIGMIFKSNDEELYLKKYVNVNQMISNLKVGKMTEKCRKKAKKQLGWRMLNKKFIRYKSVDKRSAI